MTLGKDGRPSEANHGNVTPSFGKYTKGAEGRDPLPEQTIETIDLNYNRKGDDGLNFAARVREKDQQAREGRIAPGGVTISHAEQSVVLSLPALRRLRFPVGGKYETKVENAARTVLAALGLCAATLTSEAGLDLRSRCLLWPVEPLTWSLLGKPGESPVDLQLDGETAFKLLKEAVKQANDLGLPWHDKPVVLTPSDALVKLVVKSHNWQPSRAASPAKGVTDGVADDCLGIPHGLRCGHQPLHPGSSGVAAAPGSRVHGARCGLVRDRAARRRRRRPRRMDGRRYGPALAGDAWRSRDALAGRRTFL